jgi:hypothetical protein
MSVIFENPGIIDKSLITNFGVNVKEGNNPFGYFGTGLKYAIAVLLREGQQISIYSGIEKYKFTVKDREIRGKLFNFVQINGEDIGFTTELGKNWEMWQAFRELYCNCKDEYGREYDGTIKRVFKEGASTFVVVDGEKFEDIYRIKSFVALQDKPLAKNEHLEIHQKNDWHGIYYRGIRVGEVKNSFYTYNVLDKIDLTEDRTVKYSYEMRSAIAKGVMKMNNEEIISPIMLPQEEVLYENDLNFYSSFGEPSKAFLKVAEKALYQSDQRLNRSIKKVYMDHSGDKNIPCKEAELTPVQKDAFKKAKRFVENLGYNIDEFPIVIVPSLGDSSNLALAEDGKSFISLECFEQGTKYLAHVILEEYLHLKYDFDDCTREFQNHLFKKIISMGEERSGKAL